jgi:hypothetical protein
MVRFHESESLMNDYEQMEACIREAQAQVRASNQPIYFLLVKFMKAVYSKLQEIAPEIN